MKNLFLLAFTCTVVNLHAQTNYNCYHLQEFLWNSNTNLYDTPVERTDKSKFKIDKEKKSIIQTFSDGNSISTPITTYSNDNPKGISTFSTISTSNGYTYIYRINSNSQVIEVSLANSGKETLLKKYLYKD